VPDRLPVVLHIKRMRPPSWRPPTLGVSKLRARHRAQQKARECVSRVRREWKLRSSHEVAAGREGFDQRIIRCAYQLITELQSMLAEDLGHVFLEAVILPDAFAEATGTGVVESAATAVEKIRKRLRTYVGNSELFGPVAILRRRLVGLVPPIVSEPELVYQCRAEGVAVRDHDVGEIQ